MSRQTHWSHLMMFLMLAISLDMFSIYEWLALNTSHCWLWGGCMKLCLCPLRVSCALFQHTSTGHRLHWDWMKWEDETVWKRATRLYVFYWVVTHRHRAQLEENKAARELTPREYVFTHRRRFTWGWFWKELGIFTYRLQWTEQNSEKTWMSLNHVMA